MVLGVHLALTFKRVAILMCNLFPLAPRESEHALLYYLVNLIYNVLVYYVHFRRLICQDTLRHLLWVFKLTCLVFICLFVKGRPLPTKWNIDEKSLHLSARTFIGMYSNNQYYQSFQIGKLEVLIRENYIHNWKK